MYSGLTTMRAASLRRFEDAEALLSTQRWLGAIYLYGYWVEMTIKVRLMEEYGVDTLEALNPVLQKSFGFSKMPEIHRKHTISWLTFFHPGFIRLRDASKSSARSTNSRVLEHLALVDGWSSELRYSPDKGSQLDTENFKAAAQIVVRFTKHS
ncbi:hypothetical protein L6R46_01530 [Myxococcota bacterium]|nr:hypothetical protein [Myxococcota bacterium]